ncbi:MAG TPA: hypothetical protein PKB06_08315, partial [Actinotalea sp.]|nr:hypothetical protein [Actinotalea sp.]
MRRRRRGAGLLTALVVLAVLVVSTAAFVTWLRSLDDSAPRPDRCAAAVDGTSWYLDPVQADHAALIALTAVRRGLPARAATIGLASALQESGLRNLPYGDRDSLGLFQQRPSQGWGTEEQVMDPVYSTNTFYDVLVTVDGYQDLPITEAAQRVQRSAFPDAYAQHEGRSRAWASALAGYSPTALTCRLGPAQPVPAEAVLERVDRDLGAAATATAEGGLDDERETDRARDAHGLRAVAHGLLGAGQHRHADALSERASGGLVAHHLQQ